MPAAVATAPATVVTVDNFIRAETDMYFAEELKLGSLGKFRHYREPMPVDRQTVVRPNRDTLYSVAIFDLDAGPATITLPDARGRFMSMQAFDEDHYVVAVVYGAGTYTYSRDKVGTRYMLVAVRTLIDPTKPGEVDEIRRVQDAIQVQQKSAGSFDVPAWDSASQKKVRDALIQLGATVPDTRRTFGARGQVDPVRHLIGTATAWGGNPEKDALYLTVTPAENDGTIIHRLTVKDVPVDGFWSISVYNARGFFEVNKLNAYSLNNLTAKKEPDGSVIVQFGGCDGRKNCLPIMPGWNYTVRLYRPRPEILSGQWTFPEAQPVA
jgi:hypothetical protein